MDNDDKIKIDPRHNGRPEPYVENYPPLREWLHKHEMRCSWQTRTMRGAHASMVEHYIGPGGGQCIVIVHANGNGWDIFTPCNSTAIDRTFADAELRMGITLPKTVVSRG